MSLNNDSIIRAWKDPAFRASLTPDQRAELPANPSGPSISELNEDELMDIVGGIADCTCNCCTCCNKSCCSCSAA